jgi:hypothetical protein
MKQQTLAMAADQGAGFEQYRRPTKRDVFLETMEQIVPCESPRVSRRLQSLRKWSYGKRKEEVTKVFAGSA